jgi:hypothetical protein
VYLVHYDLGLNNLPRRRQATAVRRPTEEAEWKSKGPRVNPGRACLYGRSGRTVMERLSDAARRRNAALIVVGHDQRVLSFCDVVLEMEDGRLAPTTPERAARSRMASADPAGRR